MNTNENNPQETESKKQSEHIPTIWKCYINKLYLPELPPLMNDLEKRKSVGNIDSYTLYCSASPKEDSNDQENNNQTFIILIRFFKQNRKSAVLKIYRDAKWSYVEPDDYPFQAYYLYLFGYVPVVTVPGCCKYGVISDYAGQRIEKGRIIREDVNYASGRFDRYNVLFDRDMMSMADRDVRLIVMGDLKDNIEISGMEVDYFLFIVKGEIKYVLEFPIISEQQLDDLWYPNIKKITGKVIYEVLL